MGFRSYVRQCLGTILMLLRPSLPWCFPIREVSFETKVCFWFSACRGDADNNSNNYFLLLFRAEKAAKIIIFYGFQKLREGFTAMVFSHPGGVFGGYCVLSPSAAAAGEKVAKVIIFSGFQKFGIFGRNFASLPYCVFSSSSNSSSTTTTTSSTIYIRSSGSSSSSSTISEQWQQEEEVAKNQVLNATSARDQI